MIVLAAAIPAQLALTQQGTGGPGGATPNKEEVVAKLEKIAAELQLTPKQKMQMLPILKDEAQQLKALKENTALGPIQKLMQLKQIDSASDAKIMSILDPMQQQKWQAIRQEQRQQMLQKLESN
jgi:hypothetical protein